MSKLEDLLRGLVKECTPHAADRDSLTVQYTPPNSSTPLELDFKSPFQRIHIVDFLNTSLQIHLLALLEGIFFPPGNSLFLTFLVFLNTPF
jgi:hypothetical protein